MAWNRTAESAKPAPKKKPSAARGVIAGIAVVAIGVAAYFAFVVNDSSSSDKSTKERNRIKDVKPAKGPSSVSDNGTPKASENKDAHKAPSVVDSSQPQSFADGAELPVPDQPPLLKVFETSSDQVLAMMRVADGTGTMPPTPMGPQEEKAFRESLKKPIKINPDDPEDVKALKQRVMETREQMKELLDSGENFNTVIREHEKLVEENYQIRRNCILEAKQIFESGDVEGAEQYVKKMNYALPQMGIKEIDMPKTKEQHVQELLERMEELRAMKEAKEK